MVKECSSQGLSSVSLRCPHFICRCTCIYPNSEISVLCSNYGSSSPTQWETKRPSNMTSKEVIWLWEGVEHDYLTALFISCTYVHVHVCTYVSYSATCCESGPYHNQMEGVVKAEASWFQRLCYRYMAMQDTILFYEVHVPLPHPGECTILSHFVCQWQCSFQTSRGTWIQRGTDLALCSVPSLHLQHQAVREYSIK